MRREMRDKVIKALLGGEREEKERTEERREEKEESSEEPGLMTCWGDIEMLSEKPW